MAKIELAERVLRLAWAITVMDLCASHRSECLLTPNHISVFAVAPSLQIGPPDIASKMSFKLIGDQRIAR